MIAGCQYKNRLQFSNVCFLQEPNCLWTKKSDCPASGKHDRLLKVSTVIWPSFRRISIIENNLQVLLRMYHYRIELSVGTFYLTKTLKILENGTTRFSDSDSGHIHQVFIDAPFVQNLNHFFADSL